MGKLQVSAAGFFLLAAFAQAQYAEGERFPFIRGTQGAGYDKDHPWTQFDTSARFVIYYDAAGSSSGANISTSNATTALNNLEEIYRSYMRDSKFQAPFTHNPGEKKKMGVYVLRTNEGHAFGGTSAGGPGMWLSSGAVNDKWALAHEFMHGLQQATGGLPAGNTNQGTNFIGWFHESHANLMPHYVYPNEVHYCAEMYTRTAELYLGSTRNRYCNWQFFEYVADKKGLGVVNDIWAKSAGLSVNGNNPALPDPISEIMRQNGISQKDFNDMFGDFATKAVIWDLDRGSALFRAAFNKNLGNPDERFKRPRYTYLEALDGNNAANNRYVSPFAFSPQRYGFNIIRLYPDAATGAVTVRFRGDVQTQNNIPNYAKNLNLEGAVAHVPNNPGSDWRYGLVAVTGNAQATGGAVTARYSELMRASDGNPDVSIQMQNNESLYLVVSATPAIHHKISWDQFYYTIYRFPYMVEINGAKPEGFQANINAGITGANHSNGGGFVQNGTTVAATAYVGPNARVLGTARVSGTARIEGRAVVRGNAQVSGSAVVKDYALVAGGSVSDNAVISEGANIWNAQISGNAKVHGAPNISNANAKIYGNAQVGGVGWIDQALDISGTAQLLGDGEIYNVTATKGVYYGLVDDGVINNNQFGGNRTEPPTEVTKPRSMTWYDPSSSSARSSSSAVASSSSARSSSSAMRSSSSAGTTPILNFVPAGIKYFNMDNRGIFSYSLGEAASANLKIYNSQGKLLKTMQLSGSQGIANTGLSTSQVLLWRVEEHSGKLIEQRIGAVIRK